MRSMRPVLLSLVLAFAAVVTGCGDADVAPVRVGTVVWPGYEPLYLARERGTLPASQVDLVEYPSASEVIRALRNRSLEAAGLTLDEVLVLLADRVPLKVILVMDISNGGDVVMAAPGIERMQDLAGKRIGVESNALGAYMVTRALQVSGVSLRDVVIKHLDVNSHERAYLSGEVDAVVTFEPVRTRLANAGAREIFSSKQLPGEIVDVLVVHEDVYAQRPQVFAELVDTWFETLDYLSAQPEAAATVIGKRLKISPQEVLASYDGLTLPSREDNRRLLAGPTPELIGTVQKLGQVLLDNELIRRPVSAQDLLSGASVR